MNHKEAKEWAKQYLEQNNFIILNNEAELIQQRPWSYVISYLTNQGRIYVKQTPGGISLEPIIIKSLHALNMPVPQVIANHSTLNCFLMKDAGHALRPILKNSFDGKLACNAVETFALMQVNLTNVIHELMAIGVPDFRLEKMPILLLELLQKERLLLDDGLMLNEINQLKNSVDYISALCEELSSFNIQQTLVQPDFNDNNTLIDLSTHKITVIDLGEIVISHPFFSFINFMEQMHKYHNINVQDTLIRQAYFKIFRKFQTDENIKKKYGVSSTGHATVWCARLLPINGSLR